jgi:hypothetical protein
MVSRVLRGFIIGCSFETDKIENLESKLAKEHGFEIRPYISTCTGNGWDKRSHALKVHSTHIKVLDMCSELNWAPCLVFEADAMYSGHLHSSLLLAMQENDHWDLMPMGITAFDIKHFAASQSWPTWPRKKHSMQIAGTGGGCHAYMVQNPSMFADYLRRKNVIWALTGVPYTPCIEYIFSENIKIVLPTNVPVIQSNKPYREGVTWTVDSKGKIQYQHWLDNLVDEIVDKPFFFSLLMLTILYCCVHVGIPTEEKGVRLNSRRRCCI